MSRIDEIRTRCEEYKNTEINYIETWHKDLPELITLDVPGLKELAHSREDIPYLLGEIDRLKKLPSSKQT